MKMMRDWFARKKAPPDTPEDTSLARRFEWRVDLSRLALIGERVWEALLWPFIVLAAFLILSMFDLWSALPPLLHRALLVAFAVALLVSLVPLIRFPMPTRAEALRRLERHADIKHRPASSYEDKLGTTSRADTALLWAAHREWLSRLVAKLKPSWPLPRTDRKDPYAVRSAFLLVLIVALLAAGPNRWDRITAAFTPAARTSAALMRLDAWVTPPVYTEVAPIVLADGSESVGAGNETFRALSVPERSELIVRARSFRRSPAARGSWNSSCPSPRPALSMCGSAATPSPNGASTSSRTACRRLLSWATRPPRRAARSA